MPDKITKDVVCLALFASFLMTVAKGLSEKQKFKRPMLEWTIRFATGMASGFFFGSLGLWIFGDNQAAIFAITSAGTIVGMDGVKKISLQLSKLIDKKIGSEKSLFEVVDDNED